MAYMQNLHRIKISLNLAWKNGNILHHHHLSFFFLSLNVSKFIVYKAKVTCSVPHLPCRLRYKKIMFWISWCLNDVSIFLCSHIALLNFSESLCRFCSGVIQKSAWVAIGRFVVFHSPFTFLLLPWFLYSASVQGSVTLWCLPSL